jgi:hypothetical protein
VPPGTSAVDSADSEDSEDSEDFSVIVVPDRWHAPARSETVVDHRARRDEAEEAGEHAVPTRAGARRRKSAEQLASETAELAAAAQVARAAAEEAARGATL